MDERLRVPLSKLWPDIRVPGLPVVTDAGTSAIITYRASDGSYVQLAYYRDDGFELPWSDEVFINGLNLDLSRPGASDILARRVAHACGHGEAHWTWAGNPSRGVGPAIEVGVWPEHRSYYIGEPSMLAEQYWHPRPVAVVPELADLDKDDDSRLDWGPLGSPRVVDLVALGIVAQHLYGQE